MARLRLRRPAMTGTARASRSERRNGQHHSPYPREAAHATGTFEKRRHSLDIADIAGGQHQHVRAADDVGERMDGR